MFGKSRLITIGMTLVALAIISRVPMAASALYGDQ